jgi:DNA sulfur modification protein DndC
MIKSKKINSVIDEIIDQYTCVGDLHRPWIIGFSGGKDSTVLLTLVWIGLRKIREQFDSSFKLQRPIYVVCNDTLVENPIITTYVETVLTKIEAAARDQDLPIFIKKTTPKLDESFWINVIGKGYPVPNSTFRWCTDKLKIRPTSSFLHEKIDEKGEAIVLLGTRYDESQSRERSMKRHEIKGERLSKHTNGTNTWVYAPIKDLILEEVWYIINSVQSPWGFDNNILFQIYSDASADDYECPTVVTNKEHKSCGQSRFGCWTCTVVQEDKSMSALVNKGYDWMKPLIKFRNSLAEERNNSEFRMSTRRNGNEAIDIDGNNRGAYSAEYRASILKRLLHCEKEVQKTNPEVKLITNQELIGIQVTWTRDGIFEHHVRNIYKEVYDKEMSISSINSLAPTERRILKDICSDKPKYYDLIDNLLEIQHSKTLMISKYGLHNDVEKQIERFVNEN